ncbi:helix-turn-helix transcriptional regulator [Thiothrix fructosivorans]|uniref:Helix-turn-helix domain-containing protein n=1 Tax=Thiothrix fructosivorans TaxID=111770 RepID=A0A8B0SKF9_9GAMM|nr:helix-turn-helix domain-containing protein [Thiothrix fructosivorans]MBO0612970.1 helix-turn-helix domain-containing protein [Thiothrix fructosivorans]QTX11581.1 helix-turn-helix domain-containing protein [Thiothrix fructosivorans]
MLTMHQLRAMLNLSKTTIYELIKTSGFPAPHKFGKASRWAETEVEGWIKARRNAA